MTEAAHDPTDDDRTQPAAGQPVDDASSVSDDLDRPAEAIDPDPAPELAEIDVAGIEADLDGVQQALTRLADGTYWTDEVTGEPIPADVLAANPLARRA